MAAGPHEARLAQAIVPMRAPEVTESGSEWRLTANRLDYVKKALHKAAAAMQAQNSGATAEKAREAFQVVAKRTDERSTQMAEAAEALAAARGAMVDAEAVHRELGPAPSEPTAPPSDPTVDPVQQLKAQQHHSQQVSAYHSQMADRDAKAKAALENMDKTYAESTEVMRSIHGQPDPVKVEPPDRHNPGGGSPGGSGGGGNNGDGNGGNDNGGGNNNNGGGNNNNGGGNNNNGGGNNNNGGGDDNGGGDNGGGDNNGGVNGGGQNDLPTVTGVPQGPGLLSPTSSSAPGGSVLGGASGGAGGLSGGAGATAAGVGVGALGIGALSGLGTAGQPGGVGGVPLGGGASSGGRASGVRPIGATSRTGSGGVLGTGGTQGGRAGAGRAGAGRAGGSRRGAGGGRRGTAGGRGAGTAAGAGGQKGGRRRKADSADDPFLVQEDWLDEDGLGPDVLR